MPAMGLTMNPSRLTGALKLFACRTDGRMPKSYAAFASPQLAAAKTLHGLVQDVRYRRGQGALA
jgi:hypothetical protein